MLRLVKRGHVSKRERILIYFLSVLAALVTSGLFVLLMGHSPWQVFQSMILGAFGSRLRFQDTMIIAVPLIITSVGIMIAFKMKFWNIGGEGQILIGALFASYFALNFSDWPRPVLLLVMLLAGFAGGALVALIPAVLKVKLQTNETIVTLMLNYIAFHLVTYLQYGPWRDPNSKGFPKIANFSANALLPKVFGLHMGWIIMLILVVAITILLRYTKIGYKIAVVGESKDTARYAGMNLNRIIISSVAVSGGICGMVGMIEAAGVNYTLTPSLTGGYGFLAIITTWLSGLNPVAIIPVSVLFAALTKGGNFIQTAFQIPQSAASVIQSIILFFVIGAEFFIQYRIVGKEKG
ncbi:ABC transporter permease [Clostridiales bacterium COT073_COT-073]|nr:ABC transporter permease [Clostridiales bacterium COT073_COT-073]